VYHPRLTFLSHFVLCLANRCATARAHGFGRAAGRYDREDFRPSSIGRTRSGLWEPPRP
jgi:hypothetical protein